MNFDDFQRSREDLCSLLQQLQDPLDLGPAVLIPKQWIIRNFVHEIVGPALVENLSTKPPRRKDWLTKNSNLKHQKLFYYLFLHLFLS